MTGRTVLDVALGGYVSGWPLTVLRSLGVDPDMTFDEFQRALKIGLRVVRQSGTLKCGCPDEPMLMIRHERGCREVSQDDW